MPGRLEVTDPKDTLSLCLHCRVMVSKLVATHRLLTTMELFTWLVEHKDPLHQLGRPRQVEVLPEVDKLARTMFSMETRSPAMLLQQTGEAMTTTTGCRSGGCRTPGGQSHCRH